MNIAKLIAKYIKQGFDALTAEEKSLLKANETLMSAAQRKKFADDTAADGSDDEGADEDGADEGAEDEDEDDEDGEDLDEKGLKALIAKSVKNESGKALQQAVDNAADQIVARFLKGVSKQRSKVLSGDVEVDKTKTADEKIRKFFKALINHDRAALNEMQKATTYNETGDDAKGAYLIPEELRAEVLRIAQTQYGLARRAMRYLPFTGPGNSRKIPTLATSVSVYWTDEGGKKGGTNPTFGIVTQTLKKLTAIIPFTEEILEDSAVNITQLLAELFAEAVAKEEDTQFFAGTGSPWTGILNNVSVGSVQLSAGQGVTNVTIEKLIDMQDEVATGSLVGAKYYMHRHILNALRKQRADAVSASDQKGLFLYPTQADIEGQLGYPIELSDVFPDKTTTAHAKPFVAFGNLNVAAILGDKQQIRVKLLDQATITDGDGTTALNLAEEDMLALRMEERVGYVFALPEAVSVLKTGNAS